MTVARGALSAESFRQIMGRFPTGVTIVTSRDAQGMACGLTANAVTSVSLDPPLILVCVDRSSETLPAILEQRRFAVNILSAGQRPLADRFARRAPGKFEGVPFFGGPLGTPILEGVAAWLECELQRTIDGGDHKILIGKGVDGDTAEHDPLIFSRGAYFRIGDRLAP